MITSLLGTLGTLQQGQNLVSGATTTLSNTLFGTAGTCSRLPTDDQLRVILDAADPNEPAMKRTRERFGRAETERRTYLHLVPNGDQNMLIYYAPLSVVGNWARYDCKSAGPIRQSLADDLGALWSKYGSRAVSAESYGAPALTPPIQGGVSYGSGGWSGGVSFGQPQSEGGMPAWMKVVLGVLLIAAAWAIVTGRAGRTGGGLQ